MGWFFAYRQTLCALYSHYSISHSLVHSSLTFLLSSVPPKVISFVPMSSNYKWWCRWSCLLKMRAGCYYWAAGVIFLHVLCHWSPCLPGHMLIKLLVGCYRLIAACWWSPPLWQWMCNWQFLALWLLLYSNSVCFEAYVTTQSLFLIGAPSSLLHACLNHLRQNFTIFFYNRRYMSFLSNDCIHNPIFSLLFRH